MKPHFLLLLSAVVFAACTSAPTPTPPPPPETILEQTAQAMQNLQSAHFVIERSGAAAFVDPGQSVIFRRGEGDFVVPDKARATVRVVLLAAVAEVSVVAIGEQYWETNPLTGEWASYPGVGYNPTAFFDPETGLASVLRRDLAEVAFVGEETLEDVPGQTLWHVRASAPGEGMAAMTRGLVGRGRVRFDWWIEPTSHYLRRMVVVEPETDPQDPTVWTMDFEAFNEPVTIAAPVP